MANKANKHICKNEYWKSNNIEVQRLPLPVGDYVLMNDKIADVISRKEVRGIPVKKMDLLGTYNVAVDSKYSITEIEQNICGKAHDRFRDECILAQNNGIKLIILVENEPGYLDRKCTIYNRQINKIHDLCQWKNPRAFVFYKGKPKYPNCTKGSTLMKAMMTMSSRYGVEFFFCNPKDSGRRIIELLEGDADG